VIRPTEAAALRAGRCAEKDKVSREIECLYGDSTDIDTIPSAKKESLLGRMPGLEDLLVNLCAQLRGGRGEATSTKAQLDPANGSDDTYAAICSINSNLDMRRKVLIVELFLNRKWIEGECPPRRFGKKW
jgi:hypothetical protein